MLRNKARIIVDMQATLSPWAMGALQSRVLGPFVHMLCPSDSRAGMDGGDMARGQVGAFAVILFHIPLMTGSGVHTVLAIPACEPAKPVLNTQEREKTQPPANTPPLV